MIRVPLFVCGFGVLLVGGRMCPPCRWLPVLRLQAAFASGWAVPGREILVETSIRTTESRQSSLGFDLPLWLDFDARRSRFGIGP